jgi:predicted DNA-binding ribbon-helix-helix protein
LPFLRKNTQWLALTFARSSVGYRTVVQQIESCTIAHGLGGQTGALMKSAVIKRSIMLDGHKTSVSLEDSFWTALREIADVQGVTVSTLVTTIGAMRKLNNLSSAIRVFVLEHHRNKNKPVVALQSASTAVSSDERQSTQAWRGLARRG